MPLINFSGLASGIDSEALIEATSAATRQQRVQPLEENIANLEDETDALGELKTKLNDLKDTLFRFSSLNGGVVAKQGLSSNESTLSAVASDAAINGTYSITVEQLATTGTFSFNDRFASATDAMDPGGAAGAVSISIGTGGNEEVIAIDVDETTSPSEFVTAFNNTAKGASASLVNVGSSSSPSYAIVITSKSLGTDKGTISFNSTSGIGALQDGLLNQAQDAQISIDGIAGTITRSSNTINNVIEGVTLNLESASPGNPILLTISTDAPTTQTNIEEFVEKYNDIVLFLRENNTVTREENGNQVENIFGALARTSLDEGALTALRQAISAASFQDGGSVRIFADIGIVTERDGTLKFNKTNTDNAIANFEKAIAADPDAIKTIFRKFSDATALTGGTIDQYVRFNGLIDLSVNSSKTRISDLNDRIARAEEAILRTEQSLRARFARLEAMTSQMQGAQQALTSALAGLANTNG